MTRKEIDQLDRIPLSSRCSHRNGAGNRCRRESHEGRGHVYFALDGSASLNDERSDDS